MKFLWILILLPTLAFSLEVDEKLTVRLVKTSESKKTLMINRGTEDGLVEGDHARFIVTAGIVARAVCVRVSPTRSVWSVYRLVNADFIVTDSVMTIKITPPVKITKDESQALVQEDVPTKLPTDPQALGIPLAEGALDLESGNESIDQNDLNSLEQDSTIVEKNIEVFGMLNISGLSSTTKEDDADGEFKSSQASHHMGFGAEYYPKNERKWFSRFSLIGSLNFMRNNSQSYNGASVKNDVNEYSFGVNWHPGNMPSKTLSFIPFVHLSANMGSVKSEVESSTGDKISTDGKTNGYSLGFGYKFYTRRGFGARALLDYYVRNEKYDVDVTNLVFNKSVSGPRLILGISYRF